MTATTMGRADPGVTGPVPPSDSGSDQTDRPARWIGATLLVALLVLVTIAVFQGMSAASAPKIRARRRPGTGALGQLLSGRGHPDQHDQPGGRGFGRL